jgi:hypothetical protein
MSERAANGRKLEIGEVLVFVVEEEDEEELLELESLF